MIEDTDGNIRNMLFQAACYESNAAQLKEEGERERMRPFMLLRPAICKDGNQWCALYGQNIQDGICGFGDTPSKAAANFDINWLNEHA
jgi:hypothetical protein